MEDVGPKPSAIAGQRRIMSTPRHEHEPLERLRQRVHWLIDDFFHEFPGSPFGRIRFEAEPFWRHTMSWGDVPPIDIDEHDREYVISAELPALDKSNIELAVSGNRLTLRGEKPKEAEEAKHDYYLSDRRHGPFQRTFRIPGDVEVDKIHADLKNGLLSIILPKTAESQKKQKKIAISAE